MNGCIFDEHNNIMQHINSILSILTSTYILTLLFHGKTLCIENRVTGLVSLARLLATVVRVNVFYHSLSSLYHSGCTGR